MMGLTPRQRECLDFIRAEVKEKGVTPSMSVIALALGVVSKANAHRYVTALIERGLLSQTVKTRMRDGVTFTANRGHKLVQSEYHHRALDADCPCPVCPARRLQYQQFIEALKVEPPIALMRVVADNCIRLSDFTLRELLGRPLAAPRKRAAALPTVAR